MTSDHVPKAMATDDLEAVLRGLEAFSSGDVDGLVAELDPAVVWEEGGVVFPDLPPAYHGPAGVRRRYEEAIVAAWETFSADLHAPCDEGHGEVAQVYRTRGRGRGSGIDVDVRIVQTMTVRGGRIARRRIAPT